MTVQTKKQSIGYILKAVLGTEIPSNQLVTVASYAKKIVPDDSNISNDDTVTYVKIIAEELELEEKLMKKLVSETYYVFDMRTVEEAGEMFETFAVLFPMLNR